jgi:protein SCO1/2
VPFTFTLLSVLSVSSAFFLCVLCTTTASAQITGAHAAGYRREAGLPAAAVPAALREIGFDQNLDRQLPLDLAFVDETGRRVRLTDFFGRKPIVLAFVYYDCPLLCMQVLNALAGAVDMLSLQPGADFDIVAVSFDPREKPPLAAARKATFLQRYKRNGGVAGTHFLTGEQAAIESLTKAAGFRFVWDERLKQFAHPTGIIVLTPAGRIARYLFGIDYGPRDLRLAIVEASAGRIGSAVDSFLLYCYHYDPMTGRYGLIIMRVIRLAALATLLALGSFVGVMLRRERLLSTRGAS